MSSGHQHQESPAVSMMTMEKLLANPAVRERLFTYRQEDNGYDIPYIAGYSRKGDRLYFDRHLPETIKLKLDGQEREINPREFLKFHESLEKAIIDALGWGYFPAHAAATAYERRHVFQRLGPQWWVPYQHSMDGYAKADEHEKVTSVPKDLDMTPYTAPPVNRRLLATMRKCQGMAVKEAKTSANYTSEGRSSEHCGPVAKWPLRNMCAHYKEPHECEVVRGYIDETGWCKHWVRRT